MKNVLKTDAKNNEKKNEKNRKRMEQIMKNNYSIEK
jgi:hypothetical protein